MKGKEGLRIFQISFDFPGEHNNNDPPAMFLLESLPQVMTFPTTTIMPATGSFPLHSFFIII